MGLWAPTPGTRASKDGASQRSPRRRWADGGVGPGGLGRSAAAAAMGRFAKGAVSGWAELPTVKQTRLRMGLWAQTPGTRASKDGQVSQVRGGDGRTAGLGWAAWSGRRRRRRWAGLQKEQLQAGRSSRL